MCTKRGKNLTQAAWALSMPVVDGAGATSFLKKNNMRRKEVRSLPLSGSKKIVFLGSRNNGIEKGLSGVEVGCQEAIGGQVWRRGDPEMG